MTAATARLLALALVLPAVSGCAVIAVADAVVTVGVVATKVVVKSGVAVGKGVYKVGDAMIGDSDEEKAAAKAWDDEQAARKAWEQEKKRRAESGE